MADTKNYQLEILTPFKSVFQGEVDSLIATGADGLFGVLVNHAPMLSALGFGPLLIRSGGKEKWYVLSDGFFEIRQNKAVILVDTAELKDDIDVTRAEAARDRAMGRLQERGADDDIDRARAALNRALVRLQTASRN